MISAPQITGRPDLQLGEFATLKSFAKMKADRSAMNECLSERLRNTGEGRKRKLPVVLEKARSIGNYYFPIVSGFGANKIFSAPLRKCPL